MQTYAKPYFSKPSKLLPAFQRYVSRNPEKKRSVGETVKRLNKENKYLFGNLLESRSERKKSVVDSRKQLNAGDGACDNVLPCEESEINIVPELPRTQTKLIRSSGLGANSDCVTSTPQTCETPSSPDITVDSVVKPLQRNNSSVILPSVVLKNIKGFPLINRNKTVNASYSLEPPDSLVSRSKEYSKIYPSVGKILNATMSDMSKMLLKKWREKMISLLGEDGFLKFYKGQLNAGVQFHTAVQSFLRGASEESLVLDGQGVAGCWKSLSSIIADINDVQLIEGPVCHSHLFYHGVLDCFASYQGEEVLIEWKKSDKPKPTLEKTYDAPVQLSAYIGALNYDQNYPLQVKGGLVVIAYSDGSPADVFHLNLSECNKYWKSWLERVQLFWLQQVGDNESTSENGNKKLL